MKTQSDWSFRICTRTLVDGSWLFQNQDHRLICQPAHTLARQAKGNHFHSQGMGSRLREHDCDEAILESPWLTI